MNTYEQDRAWANRTLRGADPATDAGVAALVDDVRAALDERLGADVPRAGRGGHRSVARAVGAVAAALVVLLVSMPVVAVVTDPAWAVEQLDDGRVRVEHASTLGHGPDPAGIVEALRAQGVNARIGRVTSVWPLAYGSVVGIVTEFRADDARLSDGLPDPSRYGMEEIERGYILDPDPFRRADGVIIIQVGQPPWE